MGDFFCVVEIKKDQRPCHLLERYACVEWLLAVVASLLDFALRWWLDFTSLCAPKLWLVYSLSQYLGQYNDCCIFLKIHRLLLPTLVRGRVTSIWNSSSGMWTVLDRLPKLSFEYLVWLLNQHQTIPSAELNGRTLAQFIKVLCHCLRRLDCQSSWWYLSCWLLPNSSSQPCAATLPIMTIHGCIQDWCFSSALKHKSQRMALCQMHFTPCSVWSNHTVCTIRVESANCNNNSACSHTYLFQQRCIESAWKSLAFGTTYTTRSCLTSGQKQRTMGVEDLLVVVV